MEFRDIPYGNGQTVYIDEDWINGEDEKDFLLSMPESMETSAQQVRREMIAYLTNSGYKVITDSSIADDDTFFFSPCWDKHINSNRSEYEIKTNKKIIESLAKGSIKMPFTIEFPDSTFPDQLPSLPFVLKNEHENGGKEKYLIESKEQLDILKKFYEEINAYDRKQREERVKKQYAWYNPNLEFDEEGHSKDGFSLLLPNYKEILHNDFVIQKFINTPTKYNTSLRVITSSSGDILCASLKYSESCELPTENNDSIFDRYLINPESPYSLNCKSMVSNTIAGGSSILLGKDKYTELEKTILNAHEIDPNNALVPEAVKDTAIRIALNCKREIGSISGMDFIFDDNEKCWKYLEQHQYPMLITYAEAYGLPYYTDPKHFFETNRLVDIDSRLNALSLTINKKMLSAESESIKHKR